MTRLLGIDYGRARIGLALSDKDQVIASPFETISAGKSLSESAENILNAVLEKGPFEAIALGLPLNMDDSESEMSKEVRKFTLELEKIFSIPVHLVDERLTSYEAETFLQEKAGLSSLERRGKVDKMAAALILRSFMEA